MNHKLTIAAKKMGLHRQTLWTYIKNNKIQASRAKNGLWYVSDEEIDKYIGIASYEEDKGVAIYARVSSSENKPNLESQAQRLVQFANAKGWKVVRVEMEIGSGVNDQRPKLIDLIKNAHKYEYIIVEHKDRLTRFGFNYINSLINNIYVVNEVDLEEHGLMEDLVSIITSFCARLYGQRRSKRRTEKLIAELNAKEDE